MTEPEFDALLRQALRTEMREDFDAAWASDGPVPPRSEEHRAWEERFLADPFAAVEQRRQKARKKFRSRQARRTFAAAVFVAVLAGCAAVSLLEALGPWTIRTDPVTFEATGEIKDHYELTFDRETFSLDRELWSDQELPEFGHWYPTWLPKFEGLQVSLELEHWSPDQMNGYVRYATTLADGETVIADGHTYANFSVSFEQWPDSDSTHRWGTFPDGELCHEETTVGHSPALLFWDSADPVTRYLFWFNAEEFTFFYMSYSSDDLNNDMMLKIAKSMKKVEKTETLSFFKSFYK